MKLKKLHHISIIQTDRINCAWVRISCNGKKYSKSFPFKKYGGKKLAIEAAIKDRDIQGKRMHGEYWPNVKYKNRSVNSNNTSGVVGVSYSKKHGAWVTSWQVGSGKHRKQRHAYYSVLKYGARNAKALAIERRHAEVSNNALQ